MYGKGLEENKTEYPDCCPEYHKEKTCLESFRFRLVESTLRTLKLYLPIHIISPFISGSLFTTNLAKQKAIWLKIIKNTIYSS
jgi:hypothetical protein